MSHSVMLCKHCGRPIGGVQMWIGSNPYHPECTQGPQPKTVEGLSPYQVEQVRQIVMQELIKTGVLVKRDPMD
ncbi:MAG TPA: hypothetical protein VFM33_10045 [Aquabacterium sp.]|nr:hypothetical protein [Aquabacterium sp.]